MELRSSRSPAPCSSAVASRPASLSSDSRPRARFVLPLRCSILCYPCSWLHVFDPHNRRTWCRPRHAACAPPAGEALGVGQGEGWACRLASGSDPASPQPQNCKARDSSQAEKFLVPRAGRRGGPRLPPGGVRGGGEGAVAGKLGRCDLLSAWWLSRSGPQPLSALSLD